MNKRELKNLIKGLIEEARETTYIIKGGGKLGEKTPTDVIIDTKDKAEFEKAFADLGDLATSPKSGKAAREFYDDNKGAELYVVKKLGSHSDMGQYTTEYIKL